MVINTLLFNDEFDMLAIHLAITSNYVDRWIIGEGNRTFSGLAKPYHLQENIDRFPEYKDRITIVPIDLTNFEANWQCENQMRKGLQPAIDLLDPDDIVIHADLDEIINPEHWKQILAELDQHNKPVSVSLSMFIYRFDQQADRNWSGPVVARRHMFTDCHTLYKGTQHKKKDRSHCHHIRDNHGWHWTWIGPDDRIRNKVQSCIESQHRDPEQVLGSFKALDTAAAINHKCATKTVDPMYPKSVQSVLSKYPQYWTNPPQGSHA